MCEVAGIEDVSVFPPPKLSDESLVGSDSLSVSLPSTNKPESAAEN